MLRPARWIVALVGVAASAMAAAQDGGLESADVDRLIERAYSQPTAVEASGGWSLSIDNDLFAPTQSDRDYTGGIGLTVSGAQTSGYWWSLDPALRNIDRLFIGGESRRQTTVEHAVQAGLVTFTPQDLLTREVDRADRPYASLAFVTAAREYLAPDLRSARYSDLTLGVLGLSLTSDLHSAVHRAVGSPVARGYAHQISAGGEPTLRYATGGSHLRAQRLALGSRLMEAKTTWEVSTGYLTEMSYAVSTRLGNINSSWWTFNPERVDYIVQPSPIARATGSKELYVWAGVKARLRAYNAFLQGQFRDSDHRLGAGDLNHVIGEFWLGITARSAGGTQVSYAVRYQTAEIRDGPASRNPVWAGLTLSHSF
jgi:hypothetical protein